MAERLLKCASFNVKKKILFVNTAEQKFMATVIPIIVHIVCIPNMLTLIRGTGPKNAAV